MKTLVIFLLLFGTACADRSVPLGGGPGLTVPKAEHALNRLAADNNLGHLTVIGGIREIPAQSMATVEFTGDSSGEWASSRGTATFSKYNDGRWFLTSFTARLAHRGGAAQHVNWKPSIEVK